jgi:uncharacterized membrane protein
LARIDREIIVNSTLERVFRYVSDPYNWPELWPSLMAVEDVKPLSNGGFSARYEYKMIGMRFKGTGECTDYVPNQWMVIDTKGGIHGRITLTFRSIEDKTRVTITIEYTVPVPLLGKLTEYVVLKMNEQEANLVLNNLRLRFMVDIDSFKD